MELVEVNEVVEFVCSFGCGVLLCGECWLWSLFVAFVARSCCIGDAGCGVCSWLSLRDLVV